MANHGAKLLRPFGIQPIDIGITAVVAAAVELNVAVATGPRQVPLDALAYVFGAVVALPILLRRRWPLQVLIACSVLLFIFYAVHRRDISPVPLLAFPVYDAATAGYLAWAIAIPAGYMTIGLILAVVTTSQSIAAIVTNFWPSIALLALAVVLGDTMKNRRALAAETAERLRLADEEREAEAGRRVAEERLRIARELHDTVAHAMATIAVQAGAALHRNAESGADAAEDARDDRANDANDATLRAIRQTSKTALADMRATLGTLRQVDTVADQGRADVGARGLDRLDELVDAVRAAGTAVSVTVEGTRAHLPPDVDHAVYRILQESLTNVLRHAGRQASATVDLCYATNALTIRVTDDGGSDGRPGPGGDPHRGPDNRRPTSDDLRPTSDDAEQLPVGGNGLIGMAERAASVGGEVTAGPCPNGGFQVIATLPLSVADTKLFVRSKAGQ